MTSTTYVELSPYNHTDDRKWRYRQFHRCTSCKPVMVRKWAGHVSTDCCRPAMARPRNRPIVSQTSTYRESHCTRPTRTPYTWATWLPRLLTGENSCEWAVWFKAHHRNWTRTPSEFNQAEWLLNHTALLNEHRQQWVDRGYDVRVEAQNAFRLRGHSATLAGKPDLLVLQNDRVLIVDVKTGQEQPWHRYQLMIYMYALPRAMPEYRDAKLAGEIIYSDRRNRVPQGGIDQGFIRNLGA